MDTTSLRTLLNKRFHLPKDRAIYRAVTRFTSAEKAVFFFFTGVFCLTSVIMLLKVNSSFLVKVPIRGGSVTEGIVGNPRFINPILALSEADKSLSSLIYSGLVRIDSNGKVENDLAQDIDVSDDGLTYTIKINPEAVFHDGMPVTSEDVVFTIQKILDPDIKSPIFADFAGVIVSKIDEHSLTITLRRPYASFVQSLTLGILPKHIWSSVTNDEFSFSQWNVLPLGSGPYKVDQVTRDSGGIPNYYELTPFEDVLGKKPFISKLIFKFYQSESDLLEAYDGGEIESFGGVSPKEANTLKKLKAEVVSAPLPRVFAVFFNQNSNKALLDKAVRQALNLTAPKEDIVQEVLDGFGEVIDGPLPASFPRSATPEDYSKALEERFEIASTTLAKAGWTKNEETGVLEKKSKTDTIKLSFTISTSDNPDLKKTAEILKSSWSKLGAEVNISIYEAGDLNQSVIRPRRYDALLFGEVIGREGDLFPFWHSSERNDPGLNIALYVNNQADKLLESIRTESDAKERDDLYRSFDEIVKSDIPAIFIYSPDYIYISPLKAQGVSLEKLLGPQDRFLGIRDWYIETNSVWTIFEKTY